VPFCPNAGWVDWVCCVLAAEAWLVPDWELVDGVEVDWLYAGDELVELPSELAVDVAGGVAAGAAVRLFSGCQCARRDGR
jgi:hypothetical protein